MTTPLTHAQTVSVSAVSATDPPFQGLRDAPPPKRKLTNLPFFLAFIVCLALVIPFSLVFALSSNLKRLLNGYDSCGNTCGVENKPLYYRNCSELNMRDKPIAMMKYYDVDPLCIFSLQKVLPDKCVEKCEPPNQLIFNRCYPPEADTNLDSKSRNFKQMIEIPHVFLSNIATITAMSFTGLILSFGLFACLRCHVAATFWTLTLFQSFVALAAAALFWHKYINSGSTMYLFLALGAMAYFTSVFIYFFVLYNTFTMVRRVYHQALNAIFRAPMILVQPLLTITVLISVITTMIFLMLLSLSPSGWPEISDEGPLVYEFATNEATLYYLIYLAFLGFWIYSFGEGFQAMVVSGATVEIYTTKDKTSLRHPVRKSYHTLLHHHLGTVACGSLLATIFAFMRGLAVYVIRKVYILTSMKGQPFCKSLKRAVELLRLNLVETIALTGFNYLIIYGFSLLIVVITVGVGVWMNLDSKFTFYVRLGILFGAVSASLVAHFVLKVLHTTTETIFLCYSEERIAGPVTPQNTATKK
nr:PREDICTED: choline transporter-like protein 3 [Tribolium castaneum]|eukprot:XP_008191667.2 PREDICTED: choline transporter-like protein 3 [Tribolium castaneum]